jgi:hypothetical protein
MPDFKERLDLALKLRNMRPSDLSKKTGIGEGAISQYRKGAYKASQRNLEKISNALGFSIPWLMGLTDDPQGDDSPQKGDDLDAYLEMLRTRPECRMLFKLADNATKEDVEKAVAIIEALRKVEKE